MRKKTKNNFIKKVIIKIKENKWLLFSAIALLLLFFFFFGTKLYLFFNFILGNDTLVKLTADKQDFFMVNSEVGEVNFEAYVSVNVFCKATCEYSFQDLSSGEILDENIFDTKISNPGRFKYPLTAPNKGEGQNLYSFEITCSSKKSSFCKTKESPKRRSYLVALNYELSDEEKAKKKRSELLLKEFISDFDKLKKANLEIFNNFNNLSKRIILSNISIIQLDSIEKNLEISLDNWEKYNYDIILKQNHKQNITESYKIINNTNEDLLSKINLHNDIISRIESLKLSVIKLTAEENISLENYNNISSLITDYNKIIYIVNNIFSIGSIDNKIIKTSKRIFNITANLNRTSKFPSNYTALAQLNVSRIQSFNSSNYSFVKSMQIPKPICCYNGECEACCDASCQSDPSKYPIILVHGHSFNNAISAESSLGDLDSIQQTLSDENYIDGGYVLIRSLKNTGTFKRTSKPIVFATSYYFDIYQTTEKDLVLQTKGDSLETYAIRLKDIIENVKIMTQKDKVIIISHSMGGLVSRRYLQLFGENSVEKLIMIATPNHGIDGYILSGCSILGSDIHCQSMDKNSLFLNKLNFGNKPKINTSVIIGIGCDLDDEVADGVVKNSSAYLSWADNYYVNGTCNGATLLHNKILKVEEYPKTYNIIKNILNLKNSA